MKLRLLQGGGSDTATLVVEPVRYGKRNGVVMQTYVLCPYCKKEHLHGWPITYPPTPKIRRVARCCKGEYIIDAWKVGAK